MNPAAQATPQLTLREVLSIPAMRRLWLAQFVSLMGDFVALFAVLAVASFRFHASASELTGISIAYMVPTALLGPIAGVFVDRWPVKFTLIGSDLLRGVLSIGFFFATTTAHFYIPIFGIGLLSTFFGPAQGIAIRVLVPKEGLFAANTLMQQVMFLMRVAGPGLAGLLISHFGPEVCYAADTLSFVASALMIASITIVRPVLPPDPHATSTGLHKVWLDMRAGFDFILHHAVILFVVAALGAATFAIGCFAPLIAVYVRDILHRETGVFSMASALIGAGMLFGSMALRPFASRFPPAWFVFSGLGGLVIATLLLGLTIATPLTLVASLFTGLSVACVLIPTQVLLQSETPPELLGRVGSTVMSVAFASQVVGLVVSGKLEHLVGIRNVFLLIAGLLVVQLMVSARFRPQARGTTT